MRAFPKKIAGKFPIFRKIKTPVQVQDLLNTLRVDLGERGSACRSPRRALEEGVAGCVDGAMLAAAGLWHQGRKPMLLDLRTGLGDDDHVVALYKEGNRWGAISHTNHAVLRFRDPVYKSMRELAMSYFHEYFLDDGRKTMREYSAPLSLLAYEDDWLVSPENLWQVPEDLDAVRHFAVASKRTLSRLRAADPIEREAGKIVRWKK